MTKLHLLDLLPDEFKTSFKARFQEPAYRAGQILDQFYALRSPAWETLTAAPQSLRQALAEHFSLDLPSIGLKRVSGDGTVKYLFRLVDGVTVESVLINEEGRHTVCFSTQAGCALGCAFCATGRGGFKRQLRTAEMVGQVMAVENDAGVRVTNCVAMGQGEPFLNLAASVQAVRILNDPRCFGLSSRRLTVSTAGIAPAIRELPALNLRAGLAVSLHSARQEVRERLMPIAKKHSLTELKEALGYYVDQTKNRVTFEYIILAGINDADHDARALADFSRGLPVFVNLIPWNRVPGMDYTAPDEKGIGTFLSRLERLGLEACVRREKGGDIGAACGQLTQQCLPEYTS